MNVNAIVDKYKDWIVGINLCGSSVLQYINNPHDKDYVIYVKDLENPIHYDFFKDREKNECWFVIDKKNASIVKIYSYISHFYKNLYGENLEKNFNIFEHESELKELLIEIYLKKNTYTKNYKGFYHVLTLIYMFKNRSYDLTEEQIKNIQLCHDRKMTDEIYDFIQENLKNYMEKQK